MEWGRIKTIFIIIFAIVNVFLLSVYLKSQYKSDDIDSSLISDTVKVLAENNIKIDEKIIPKTIETVKIFTIENSYSDATTMLESIREIAKNNDVDWFNEHIAKATNDTNFSCDIKKSSTIIDDENQLEYVRDKLEDIGILTSGKYVTVKGEGWESYYLAYNDTVIFDSYIKIKEEKGKVVKIFGKNWLGNKITEGSITKTISPIEVLLDISSRYDGKKEIKIESITVGYYAGNRSQAVKVTASPVWEIKLSNGECRYYDMRNGNLLE